MQSARLLSRVARNPTLVRNYHWHHRQQTMNDLPVPHGDFFEAYSKKQSRYNMMLAAGVIMVGISSVVFVQNSKLLCVNFSPPETYEEK